jgi:2-iminobutanoate/2-iminopropanoate deaminase
LKYAVKATVFLTDMANFSAMNTIYANFFPENPPARSTVGNVTLALSALVEIEIVAVIPGT